MNSSPGYCDNMTYMWGKALWGWLVLTFQSSLITWVDPYFMSIWLWKLKPRLTHLITLPQGMITHLLKWIPKFISKWKLVIIGNEKTSHVRQTHSLYLIHKLSQLTSKHNPFYSIWFILLHVIVKTCHLYEVSPYDVGLFLYFHPAG